nr:PREDICTED: interferon-induced GTP-binding protein Mx3-like [Lepisosteus oculatus]XP_015196911.1 PREDICTED: interferon-induced GTP-binding protein Mx3-like [Lepisosteus oculatus]
MSCMLYGHYKDQVRPFIDVVDRLRALGVDQEVPLPTVAVIGDQSSGKSSVLEALSGVQLPRGTGVMTRCPLELILKNSKDETWQGTISYRDNDTELESADQVADEIIYAQNELAGKNQGISSERITLVIESHDVPDLTLIDLPGITRVSVGSQPRDIGNQIKELINTYINKKETIILVVIPCAVDIATTEALKMAREVDPEGERTLGVLTKPDLTDKGMEDRICNILKNRVIYMEKGYMIVRCRNQEEIRSSMQHAEAIKAEQDFFFKSPFFRDLLSDKQAGINHLAAKLSAELLSQIKKCLPIIESEIQKKQQEVANELESIGRAPYDDRENVKFLSEKVRGFVNDVMALVNGDFSKEFVKETELFCFIREKFSKWHSNLEEREADIEESLCSKAQEYIESCRGRQLPGFLNYSVFEALAKKFIKDLEVPAYRLLTMISDEVQDVLKTMAHMHFQGLPNLLKYTKDRIAEIREMEDKRSGEMLKTLFKMEAMIYTQDGTYALKLDRAQSSEEFAARKDKRTAFDLKAEVSALKIHLKTYCKIASSRLADLVPMVTRFYLLHESGAELQRGMLSLLQERDIVDEMVEEEEGITAKRKALQDRQERLRHAYASLGDI